MIRIANAPCSWGVLEFDLEGESAGFEQVLDEIQETGYRGTELGDWGFLPTDPAALQNEILRRDLAMLGGFVPVNFSNREAHAEGAEKAVRTAKLLSAVADFPFIILADDNGLNPVRTQHAGRIRPEQGLNEEGWAVFTAGVEKVAENVLLATGVRSVFHHHCAGFVETPEEVDHLMSRTDPELVGLCFDTGHYAFGGGDAVEGVRHFANRIRHVHFKDHEPRIAALSRENGWDYFESISHGIFCELGQGDVDFSAVLEALKAIGYDGWGVVEQDVLPGMGSPKDSAARNRSYLKKLGL